MSTPITMETEDMIALKSLSASIVKLFKEKLYGETSNSRFERELGQKLSQAVNIASSTKKTQYNIMVKIVKAKNEFTGMSVYPDVKTLINALETGKLINFASALEMWESISNYTLEIDENVFDRNLIAFNPDELAALTFHELGHIIYSTFVPERLYRAYRLNQESLYMYDKKILSKVMGIFYIIPTFTICGIHQWMIGKNGIHEEYYCDKVFNLEDAQEHMANALNKIIRKYGNTMFTPEYEQVLLHQADVDVKWCNLNIVDISKRREKLQAEIFNRSARSKSFSIKRAYLNLSARLGVGMKDNYTHGIIATESVLDKIETGEVSYDEALSNYSFATHPRLYGALENVVAMARQSGEIAMESLKKKKPVLPSDYALDEISIEIDKIENHNDRLYVLDLIYNKITALDQFETWAKANDEYQKYEAKINQKREFLSTMRKAVISKKLVDKNYGVYVRYPVGYEG